MPMIARELRIACFAVAALLAACSSSGVTNDAGANSDGGGACGDAACTASQVCVRTVTAGGALLCPQDGGTCPDGYMLDPNGCCSMIPSYSCAARPSGCSATVTCACAATLCAPSHTCSETGGNSIACTLLAP